MFLSCTLLRGKRTSRISWRCACSMILVAKRPIMGSMLATCGGSTDTFQWQVRLQLVHQVLKTAVDAADDLCAADLRLLTV